MENEYLKNQMYLYGFVESNNYNIDKYLNDISPNTTRYLFLLKQHYIYSCIYDYDYYFLNSTNQSEYPKFLIHVYEQLLNRNINLSEKNEINIFYLKMYHQNFKKNIMGYKIANFGYNIKL